MPANDRPDNAGARDRQGGQEHDALALGFGPLVLLDGSYRDGQRGAEAVGPEIRPGSGPGALVHDRHDLPRRTGFGPGANELRTNEAAAEKTTTVQLGVKCAKDFGVVNGELGVGVQFSPSKQDNGVYAKGQLSAGNFEWSADKVMSMLRTCVPEYSVARPEAGSGVFDCDKSFMEINVRTPLGSANSDGISGPLTGDTFGISGSTLSGECSVVLTDRTVGDTVEKAGDFVRDTIRELETRLNDPGTWMYGLR